MKKALVILIVLIVAGGVVFYFGWVQILLPSDACAVIFTKTGGYDSRVTMPGTFSWRWERLIPGNLTAYRYSLAPYRTQVKVRQTLPSAELYSSVLPDKPDFSIHGVADLEFALRPESLPGLLRDRHLYPEGLPEYYRSQAEELGSALAELAAGPGAGAAAPSSGKPAAPQPEPAFGGQAAVRAELEKRFPQLAIQRLELRELVRPDAGLYELARESYRRLVSIHDRARDAAESALAAERARVALAREREASSLKSLADYGELLNKYPVLLKAMYVQNLSGKELVTVPGFDLDKVLSGLEPR
jgi:hypothetical protein